MKVRIKFRKYGVLKFIGHLDLMRYFQKAMRRANIPIAFTSGYSPHMIMSFAQPLGIGLTSDAEYLDIELKEAIGSKSAVEQLNQVMVEGAEIISFRQISEEKKYSGMTVVAGASYVVTLPATFQNADELIPIPRAWKKSVDDFLAQETIVVFKKTKRSERDVDIKPMIYAITVEDAGITLLLAAGSEENLKPDLVMQAFLTYLKVDGEATPLHFHRTEVFAKGVDGALVSLESLGTDITLQIP